MSSDTSGPTAYVYRVFDGADRLLYIGSTEDVDGRLRAHARGSDWWLFKARVETQSHDNVSDARAAEAQAIATEHPRWNIEHRSPIHPDGWADSKSDAWWLQGERDIVRKIHGLRRRKEALRTEWIGVTAELEGQEALVAAISNGTFHFELEDIS